MWGKLENIAKGVVWGLVLLVLVHTCTACKSSKQTERILVSDHEGVRVTKIQDSISINISDMSEVTTTKEIGSDTWIERTYWSVPDSAGNQYPIMTERKGNSTAISESQTSNTSVNTIGNIMGNISDSITHKSNISDEYISEHKSEDNYTLIIILIIIVFIIVRFKVFS